MNIKLTNGYYEEFIEKTPFMILVTSASGELLEANESWKNSIGLKKEDALNPSLWHYIHPYSKILCQEEFSKATPGDCFDLEILFASKDESILYTEGKFNCTYDLKNNSKIIFGILLDVKVQNQQSLEYQKVKGQFEEKSKYWQMLYDVYMNLINEDNDRFDENITEALRQFGKIVYADRAYVFEYDYKNKISINTHEWCKLGISPQIQNLQKVPFSDLDDWLSVHSAGEAIYIQDVSALPQDSSLRKILEPQEIMSLIAIPMIKEGVCYGCVGFDSVQMIRTDADVEKQILTELSVLLIHVIHRRKKYLKMLANEMRFHSIIKHVPIPFISCNDKGRIIEANSLIYNLSGYTLMELKTMNLNDLFTPSFENDFIAVIDQLNLDSAISVEKLICKKNGEIIKCSVEFSKGNESEYLIFIN